MRTRGKGKKKGRRAPTVRTKAADALAVLLAERGPMARMLRKSYERGRLRKAALGERIPWEIIFGIEKLTDGKVPAAWWSVPAVGPPPCVCSARRTMKETA